jgi:hypothetical protein
VYKRCLVCFGSALDVVRSEFRTQESARHGVLFRHAFSRLFHPDMPSGKSRTQRTAGIAGRRLYPEIVKYFLAQQRAVGYAIKRHPAGHNQIITAG